MKKRGRRSRYRGIISKVTRIVFKSLMILSVTYDSVNRPVYNGYKQTLWIRLGE